MLALQVNKAKKQYKDTEALKGLDLEVKPGEFFGLLGPNGAGKTTLISAIVGLCRLTSGNISVYGKDVVKDYMQSRELVGYSPQEVNLDRFFSIEKILQYQAGFFGIRKKQQKEIVEKLLHQFDLTAKAKVQYYKLSGGMQKRVLVAKALVNSPKLLILDEPTAGVDVKLRHDLWKYLQNLNKDGTTIILTTHYIDEAETLCQRIGIINLGEIKEIDSPQNLIAKYCTPQVFLETTKPLPPSFFADIPHLLIQQEGCLTTVSGDRPAVMIEKILGKILQQPEYAIKNVTIDPGSLEDVFLHVTGKALK